MAYMTFGDFCDDILGEMTGLMSQEEYRRAYAAYKKWMTPEKKEKKARHPDAWMTVNALRDRVAYLINSQRITIERHPELDLTEVKAFVAYVEKKLEGRVLKKDLLDIIDQNSEVSRNLNKQING